MFARSGQGVVATGRGRRAGDPGNPGDFLYRSLADGDLKQVELRLQRAPAGEPVAWVAERDLVVGR